MYRCTQNSVWLCVVMAYSPLSSLFISSYSIWKNKEIIAVQKQVAGKIWMPMSKMMCAVTFGERKKKWGNMIFTYQIMDWAQKEDQASKFSFSMKGPQRIHSPEKQTKPQTSKQNKP